jgi:hypothetical protein
MTQEDQTVKFGRIMMIVVLFFVLIACEEKEGMKVTLYEGDDVYRVYEDVSVGDTIDLPFLEHEDLVFVGWSDGEQVHYPTYVVTGEEDLVLVSEDPLDVFDYEIETDGNHAYISGYSGEALHLRIPDSIDGAQLRGIYFNAFKGLSLISVEIPDTIGYIGSYAFSEMPDLKTVTFYEGPIDIVHGELMQEDFQALIADHQDACVIESNESVTSWTYQKGCPIHAVTRVEVLFEIEGIPYHRYFVTFDLDFYDAYDPGLIIFDDAFSQLESLESIVFPETYDRFRTLILVGTPNLRTVGFAGDHPNYEVIDGVVYSRDLEHLFYYPSSLENETFTIPESVRTIHPYAFKDNTALVTIHVGPSIDSIDPTAFMGLTSLEAIHVDETNEDYWSSDGVLFGSMSDFLYLIKYPAAKPGSDYAVPSDVTHLGPQSFSDQRLLEEILLPEGLIVISREAFAYGTSLRVIDIPRRVELIDYLAFYESDIESVIIRRSVMEDGWITRGQLGTDRGGLPVFYVPDDSFDDYVEDPFWDDFEAYIRPFSEYDSD